MASEVVDLSSDLGVLLEGATAVGAGTTFNLSAVRSKFTMVSAVTGAPTGVSLTLEGSIDGSTWYVLATSTSTTGDTQFAVDKPARYVRANLGTLTGGTAPTVTVKFAAV